MITTFLIRNTTDVAIKNVRELNVIATTVSDASFSYIVRMNSLETNIAEYAAGQENIAVAYLFGSQASGRGRPESDVDIGLLYFRDKQPPPEQLLQIKADLSSLIRRETDIVILNDASPVIGMQVLRKGKKVYERDHAVAIEFFVRTVNAYDDLKRVRAVIEKNIERGRIYG